VIGDHRGVILYRYLPFFGTRSFQLPEVIFNTLEMMFTLWYFPLNMFIEQQDILQNRAKGEIENDI